LTKTQLFRHLCGRRAVYQVKELQMPASRLTFHSAFGKYFYSAHPNIFVFLEVLKLIQVQTYIKINSIQKEKKIQNSKYKKQKTNIDDHISRYKNGTINMFQFVKSVSHHYKK